MKHNKHKEGFTLVELLITAVAASILILTIALILVMGFGTWRTNNACADLRRDSALATYMMARDVREASYDTLTDGSTLTLPSAVTNQTTIYTQSGDMLTVDEGSGAMTLIHGHVQNFDSTKQNDGVLLSLELANTQFSIIITNEVFVNTRN